jgi:hypothetical protein
MKAVSTASRVPPRPSEYTVTVAGTLQEVVDLECEVCGPQRVRFPVAVLVLLEGLHLPCPICFADSSTRVVRDLDIGDLL